MFHIQNVESREENGNNKTIFSDQFLPENNGYTVLLNL